MFEQWFQIQVYCLLFGQIVQLMDLEDLEVLGFLEVLEGLDMTEQSI
jgi:hypothetical protein